MVNEKEIICGCNRIGCIICKAKLKEKTIGDFNQTIDKIKNFVSDLFTIAQFEKNTTGAEPESSVYSFTGSPSLLEKSLALAHSRIEDLKQQNEMLKRKVANLEHLPGDIQTGEI
jgi:hypothetical protein